MPTGKNIDFLSIDTDKFPLLLRIQTVQIQKKKKKFWMKMTYCDYFNFHFYTYSRFKICYT